MSTTNQPGALDAHHETPHLDANFDYAELVRPSLDVLQDVRHRLGIAESLIEHVQDLRLAPGIVDSDGQVQVRLNAPTEREGKRIVWERIDVLLGRGFVVLIEPRELTIVRRAIVRFNSRDDRSEGTFLSQLIRQVVDSFHLMLWSVERDITAHARKPAAPLPELRSQLGELDRGAEALRAVLVELRQNEALLGAQAVGQLRLSLDRLTTIEGDIDRVREHSAELTATATERERALGAESPEIIEAAATIGERRLERLNATHAVTALIGAFAVSFGAVAMSWTAGPWLDTLGPERAQLLGALAFPIGFVILLVGKSELFTENFFLPVTGVMRGRGTIRELLELWGYVLFFNLVGAVIFSFLLSRHGVLSDNAAQFLIQVATAKVDYSFGEALMKAIFAGWLMTVMTWLILAAEGLGSRLVIIWMIGFLIVAGHFNHVVISAPEIFTAMMLGAPISVLDWFQGNFVPALIGNLIGGVVFVTLLGSLQARSMERSERQGRNRTRNGR